MKIRFESVGLDYEFQRLGGHKGLATSTTTFFSTERQKEITIELDGALGLVTIAHENGEAIVVPRERVKWFTPLKPAPKVP